MTQFIQIHLLTSYPASNLNRDDLGRPKTVRMGGTERLRISSQSLKRAWRTSDLFQSAVGDHIGIRTKKIGLELKDKFIANNIDEKQAIEWAASIASVFGKLKKGSVEIEQLVHVSPKELDSINKLATLLIDENRAPNSEELKLLRIENTAVDIAMFGRMLANNPEHNVEAACQVAHAFSVHSTIIEDDFFTAVDDLNLSPDESGASHLGESAYASALFYNYICIDKTLLVDNLGGDVELANQALGAFLEVVCKVSPKGKQNSFASRAYASFVLVEKGIQQPRSLSVSFLRAVQSENFLQDSIKRITQQVENFDAVYGQCADDRYIVDVLTPMGSFSDLLKFVQK